MDTVFFILSKVFWFVVRPDALCLLALILVLLCLYRGKLLFARRLLLATLLVILPVAILPLGPWLFQILEQRFPANPTLPEKIDGIIVLGGFVDAENSAYWQQLETTDSVERGIAFSALAQRYPQARIVMTGGTGSLLDQDSREADFIPAMLEVLQVDSKRLLLERESRNTYENAVNSKQLVQPQPGENWILVTSAFHMPRAVGVFCKQGWPVIGWPVDHAWSPASNRLDFNFSLGFVLLNNATHEWLGLLAYYVSGKSSSLLPSGCSV